MDPLSGPRMLLARKKISDCKSSLAEDIPRATPKRLADHNSGRLLLEECLKEWGIPIDLIEVLRTDERAPYLSWLNGVWRNDPLPGISIGHSGDWAVCAIIENGYWIGIDAEPINRQIQENAFDMMAKGQELQKLKNEPESAIRVWTEKEAIMKSERLGMNLNPRDILIDNYIVESFIFDDLHVSVSWRDAGQNPRTAEDDLLDATLDAMRDNPDFSIGCATTRKNL
ncbi:MAG: 4'-phosphopantetheinyl transferase superfamily protein [Euryarchaeota archaeon]